MNRRKAREQAFILTFEKIFNEEDAVEELYNTAIEEEVIQDDDFTKELSSKTQEHIEDIDIFIEKYSKGWAIRRIPKVSLAILRNAICEMLYIDEVPVSVAINEAVELTKTYGGDNDSSFVNGILGSLSRDECNG